MPGHAIDFPEYPTVNPSGAPSNDFERINATPESFGGLIAKGEQQLGQGVEKASDAGFDIALAQQQNLNKVDASEQHTYHVNGITDDFSAFSQKQGRAALEALPQFKQDLDQRYRSAVDNASNPTVKTMLAESLSRDVDRYYGYATEHAAREQKTYSQNVAAENLHSRMNQSVWSYKNGDYANWENQRQHAIAETRNLFSDKGYERDQIDAEVAKTNGAIVTETTKLILDHPQGGPVKAGEFAKKYEDQIDAKSNLAIDDMLKSARANAEGQAAAQRAMGRAPGAAPSGASVAGLPANFVAGIKATEGFDARAKWDYKQFTNGYGTKAAHSAEIVDRPTADARFNAEITKAANFVDRINPNLDPGTRAALASLTFNAGEGWANQTLGQKIRDGDLAGAKAAFLQYNRAGGQVLQALADRREREASWFGKDDVGPSDAPRQANYQSGNAPGGAPSGAGPELTPTPAAVAGPGTAAALLQGLPPKYVAEQHLLDNAALQSNPAAAASAWKAVQEHYQVVQGAAADEERANKAMEKAQKQQSDDSELAVMANIYSNRPSVTSQNIIDLGKQGKLSREAVERLITKLRTDDPNAHAIGTYGPGFWDAYKQVHAPIGDPGRITDPNQLYDMAGTAGGLTIAGVEKLRAEIEARKTPDGEAEAAMKKDFFEHVARPQISTTNPEFKRYDAKGEERYLNFMAAFYGAYEKGKEKDHLTPGQMLSPDSPHYLGKLIENFKPPPGDDYADKIADKPPGIMSWFDTRAARMAALAATPLVGGNAILAPGLINAITGAPAHPAVDPNKFNSYTELLDANKAGKVSYDDAVRIGEERRWTRPREPRVPRSQ